MSDNVKNSQLANYGWTAVQRSHSRSLANVDQNKPAKISVDDLKLPDSNIANKTFEHAKNELPENTFNHCLRVYYYGMSRFRIAPSYSLYTWGLQPVSP